MSIYLEPPQRCALFLSLAFIGCHVELRESHLEERIGNPVLVILRNVDNVHVPADHQGDGDDDTQHHMNHGVDVGAGEDWSAGGLSRDIF